MTEHSGSREKLKDILCKLLREDEEVQAKIKQYIRELLQETEFQAIHI